MDAIVLMRLGVCLGNNIFYCFNCLFFERVSSYPEVPEETYVGVTMCVAHGEKRSAIKNGVMAHFFALVQANTF